MGVPLVIIHFRLGFSTKETIQRAWGNAIYGNLRIRTNPTAWGCAAGLGRQTYVFCYNQRFELNWDMGPLQLRPKLYQL